MISGNENVNPESSFDSLPAMNQDPVVTVNPIAESLPRRTGDWFGLGLGEIITMVVVSALMLCASYLSWWTIGITEAWGFVTGGICVWLVVREHVWNWPIGLANNLFFFVLFLHGRLYADMSLQIVYLGLGIYGWLNWVFGGKNHS